MSKLEELGLLDDEAQIEIPDEVPEESSGFIPLIQPGIYVLKLPDDMSTVWSAYDTTNKGKRVSAGFTNDNPLLVVSDESHEQEFKGSPATCFINNIEYPRGREGVEVSDMFYLIQALTANLAEDERTKVLKGLSNNKAFVETLRKYEGQMFKATVAWTAYCNPKKNIWAFVEDEENPGEGRTEEMEGTPGCGANYTSYARNIEERIPKGQDDYFAQTFDEYDVHGDMDGCVARLRANLRLSRFEPVTK